MDKEKIKLVFFGSSEFSVYVLDELKLHHILPSFIVTTPDKPKGRKLVMTPTEVKIWAKENNIECIDPASLKPTSESGQQTISKLQNLNSQLFLVASYGKIIPKEVFEIPEKKTLNIHPSLLPKYRGASPIQSQILNDEKNIGVTIMQIDEEMDHGPIVVQKKIENFSEKFSEKSLARATGRSEDFLKRSFSEKFFSRKELENTLAIESARLFAHILPEWLMGAIDPIMQNENEATYCTKIKKEDGELQIDLNNLPTAEKAHEYLLKIKALEEWPTTYFFLQKNDNKMRVIITDALIENNSLKILKVIPEGKKEMPFEDFLRGNKNPK